MRNPAAYGPASVMDIQAWCSLTRLHEVIDRLRRNLEIFRNEDGRELFDLPDGPRPDADRPAPVRFLPVYDNILLGHADRTRMIDDHARPRLFGSGTIGNIGSVLVDGVVKGVWRLVRNRRSATLLIEPLKRLTRGERAAVTAKGDWLLAFFVAETDKMEVRMATWDR
jgi:DNA glycosylase AlkZ-like